MGINFTKRLSVLVIILALVFVLPGMSLAAPSKLDSVILPKATTSIEELNLTPQQRQQLQALRQRRNKDIQAVLDSSQRTKLIQNLHSGTNFNQALETLNLQPGQREIIQAIAQISNLKIKAMESKFSALGW